jgi:hypothetical protein
MEAPPFLVIEVAGIRQVKLPAHRAGLPGKVISFPA